MNFLQMLLMPLLSDVVARGNALLGECSHLHESKVVPYPHTPWRRSTFRTCPIIIGCLMCVAYRRRSNERKGGHISKHGHVRLGRRYLLCTVR